MKTTEPIRAKADISRLLHRLRDWNENYYICAMILLQWGLRVSDALSLKVGDLLAGEGRRVRIQDDIIITEQKTGKQRRIVINDKMKENLKRHIKRVARAEDGTIDTSAPLFRSRRRNADGKRAALRRDTVSRAIKEACEDVGIKGHIGAHGLRKTFAYQSWRDGASVDVIQKVFGHSSSWVTHRYACIPMEYETQIYKSLNIGFIS